MLGFRYWQHPDGPMGIYLKEGSLGIFLGFWWDLINSMIPETPIHYEVTSRAVMVNALFAYMGTELIGVTVGEAENPRKSEWFLG